MAFDSDTAETIAPVLAMIGQESRLDAHWTCHMLEAVTQQVLPNFHRQQRDAATSNAERIGLGARLASSVDCEADDLTRLAHALAAEERLIDALCWISGAIEKGPEDGELLRFKASILERMGLFEQALGIAREARALGAESEQIASDEARIRARYISHLEATVDDVLPGVLRERRDAASTNAERIRFGLSLSAMPTAGTSDLMTLAQSYADDERLVDALYWASKAIEASPKEGELLRFKASILERMELFEEALRTAQEARGRGAVQQFINSDIERIGHRLVGSIQNDGTSLDPAISLPASARLLAMGQLSLGKTIELLAKILMTSLKNITKNSTS